MSQMRDGNVSDSLAYLYSCVKWTCRRECIEWPYATLDDFAAVIDLGDIQRWGEQLAELVMSTMGGDDAGDEQKKWFINGARDGRSADGCGRGESGRL